MRQTLTKINRTDRLYVFHSGPGYSCLGWEVADRRGRAVAAWCNAKGFTAKPGTRKHFDEYLHIMEVGRQHHARTGERCNAELTPELLGYEGSRVEVVDKYGERRRFIVGRSTGWLPIHLEVKTRRSHGGGGVTGAPFKSLRIVGLAAHSPVAGR